LKFKHKPSPDLDRILTGFKEKVNFCISKGNSQYAISAIRVALAILNGNFSVYSEARY
jgi:hypothetical protein